MPGMGQVEHEVTVDPIVVRKVQGGELLITGQAPKKNWWPWIIAGVGLAVAWYISEQNKEGRGRRSGERPFDE
jgi:hypothetical protein